MQLVQCDIIENDDDNSEIYEFSASIPHQLLQPKMQILKKTGHLKKT